MDRRLAARVLLEKANRYLFYAPLEGALTLYEEINEFLAKSDCKACFDCAECGENGDKCCTDCGAITDEEGNQFCECEGHDCG